VLRDDAFDRLLDQFFRSIGGASADLREKSRFLNHVQLIVVYEGYGGRWIAGVLF